MVTSKKERKIFLSIWLYLMLIFNSLSFAVYLFIFILSILSITTQLFPNRQPAWFLIISFIFFSLINIISTVFLLKWKRWAFWTFCGSAIIVFIFNLYSGQNFLLSIIGLFGVVILYFAMRPQWKLFSS